jgi:hypothetical protein
MQPRDHIEDITTTLAADEVALAVIAEAADSEVLEVEVLEVVGPAEAGRKLLVNLINRQL